MSDSILVLNAGSSSIKFAAYRCRRAGEPPEALLRGQISGIGQTPAFQARAADGRPLPEPRLGRIPSGATHEDLIDSVLEWLDGQLQGSALSAVGHRVVHGGPTLTAPVRIDDPVIACLTELVPLAPMHQPHSLAAIAAVGSRHPGLPQIACFDTAFHAQQPHLAKLFALPRWLTDLGILRYGFHGISYDYISRVLGEHLGERADGRVVVAHLGNGASACAMLGRRSRSSTMGFTAVHGLMMGRRSGTIDAGIILYLMRERQMDADHLEHLLHKESGLLGVSGISSSVQALEASDAPEAREALDLYAWRAAAEIAALLPSIGGLDALVFTAGVGEHSAGVRAAIVRHLTWLGITLDDAANATHRTRISASGSPVDVCVIPTDEECVIAEATAAALDA